jgi:hypothetical protein
MLEGLRLEFVRSLFQNLRAKPGQFELPGSAADNAGGATVGLDMTGLVVTNLVVSWDVQAVEP